MSTNKEIESLAATMELHAEEEGKILAEYRVLSEKLEDSSAGFLIDHILTEEELHHFLLRTMAKWLREGHARQGRAIPGDADRAELLRHTQTLEEHERETILACRSLKSEVYGPDRDLIKTLLDAMALDSEKHQRLLQAVEKMLQA